MIHASTGVGASILRKEDQRFLKGRGQYVGDLRMPGTHDVAFVRSPVAHARIRGVNIPQNLRGNVFTAEDLASVKPIRAATALRGFKRTAEPILAGDKVRYVGEIIAMCTAPTRAEAEDMAEMISLDFEELPAVTDMLAARRPNSALVHEPWGDNLFIEFLEDHGALEEVARTAPVKIVREFRTARHCMLPMEGRGVIAYRDDR
ncbi:MAG TPA: xanthine dehydrogenase family protein molybdopterin-binding subunit, partial [Bradyrhizobium sp.]|nr:xanthine dehydrogenase family protein molybdopterin-binding subunit [Bradyrhizobium sp.]